MFLLRAISASALCVSLTLLSTAPARSFDNWVKPDQAPIGSLQPRGQGFSPDSPANVAEQGRLSKYDKRQKRLNQKLDKKLDICRC
jgi:hypothetical protein